MTARRIFLAAVLALVVAGATLYALRAPLSLALGQRLAAERLSADPMAALPDGLHVGICGAGSPFPDEHRLGPCTLVKAGQRLMVFDAGAGSARNLGRLGVNLGRIDAVFLTHFHSDHLDGLGELLLQRWVSTGNTQPPVLHGPPGIENVAAGLAQTYAQDRQYRVAHHGEATVPGSGFGARVQPFALGPDGRAVVLREGDLEVVAFAVDHQPVDPAVGYRIRYKDRSLVISGDTVKSAAVQREAQGVDLLLHEALSPTLVGVLSEGAHKAGRANLKKVFADILNYHSTPQEAAQIARDAKVRYLMLHHIVPALPLPGMEKAFLADAPEIFTGPLRVAIDGDFLSLPAGGTEVSHSRRF